MAFAGAGRNDIATLSRLLRSLNLKSNHCNVMTRELNIATSYLQHKTRPLLLQRPAVLSTSTKFGFVFSGACGNGPVFQQQKSYAKAGPPQKKPLSFDYSGDLVTQKPLTLQATHTDFKEFTELESSSETVQKLCSIDFASGADKKIHRKEEMKERIQQLFGKDADREMHVAMLTVDIRNMIPHVLALRKDKLNKALLVEKIQLRKKMLKKLRRTDYQRFLWLLQELRIRYVLPPDYYVRMTRKFRRKQQVWEAASNLRKKKIEDLKAQLEAEKEEFLRHKEGVLKQLEEDARRYNLDLKDFEKKLERKRAGKTYPKILTWDERLQLEDGHPLKPDT